jgi:mannose-1-phosphate guanylyltransferase / mannose-6-phosphate isomerase
MYVVIMAGGGGTRLWPLSRPERPKPFLPLLGDETLLQATVRRLLDGPELPGLSLSDIAVVTDRRYGALIREQVGQVRLVTEPIGRNTAAAIALATLAIERDEDEVMVVLPADHRIDPAREGEFRGVLAAAASGLATGAFGIEDPLVTLGVAPTHAATEYGYLVPRFEDVTRVGRLTAYPLRAFEEKPVAARARELFESGGVAWNAGMFLWRRRAIRAALEKYTSLPMVLGQAFQSEVALAGAYDRITPLSIDHAVMEGAARDRRVVMGSLDVGWSDLGGWPALLEALGRPIDGGVVNPGQATEISDGDLLVERQGMGLVLREAPTGTMIPERPIALLRGARDVQPLVQALLDRCAAAEARA